MLVVGASARLRTGAHGPADVPLGGEHPGMRRWVAVLLSAVPLLAGCGEDPTTVRVSRDLAVPGGQGPGDQGSGGEGLPDGCVVDPGAAHARYRVQKGDTLTAIARSIYGDAALWREIARANPEVVGTDGAVAVGVELVIPFEGR
jgi:nucleoid-associated protein YgaU